MKRTRVNTTKRRLRTAADRSPVKFSKSVSNGKTKSTRQLFNFIVRFNARPGADSYDYPFVANSGDAVAPFFHGGDLVAVNMQLLNLSHTEHLIVAQGGADDVVLGYVVRNKPDNMYVIANFFETDRGPLYAFEKILAEDVLLRCLADSTIYINRLREKYASRKNTSQFKFQPMLDRYMRKLRGNNTQEIQKVVTTGTGSRQNSPAAKRKIDIYYSGKHNNEQVLPSLFRMRDIVLVPAHAVVSTQEITQSQSRRLRIANSAPVQYFGYISNAKRHVNGVTRCAVDFYTPGNNSQYVFTGTVAERDLLQNLHNTIYYLQAANTHYPRKDNCLLHYAGMATWK